MIGYATEQQLTDYATARGVTLVLSPAVLLTRALDFLDAQNLDIPDPVPDDIGTAQIIAAILIDGGADLLAPVGQRVLSERVEGVVSVTYSDGGSKITRYLQLDAILNKYRAPAIGFMQIGVER